MRYFKNIVVGAAVVVLLVVPAVALATSAASIKWQYHKEWHFVHFDTNQPSGCELGKSCKDKPHPSIQDYENSLAVLYDEAQVALQPPAKLATSSNSSVSSSSDSSGGGGGSVAECIRKHENGDVYGHNPIGNDNGGGAYQFEPSAWAEAWNGNPPTQSAADASPGVQDQGFAQEFAKNPMAWAAEKGECF